MHKIYSAPIHTNTIAYLIYLFICRGDGLKLTDFFFSLACHGVSHSRPFYPHTFVYKCSLQWVTCLVRGLRLLPHHQYWNLIGTPLRDPAALDLQDQPFTCSSSS